MNKEKKKFVKNIGTALKQIKEGKGLTKEEVFEMKEYFSVLRVSREDLINVVDEEDNKLIKKIKNLSDNDMKRVAGRVEKYIYDGDQWDNACRFVNDEEFK